MKKVRFADDLNSVDFIKASDPAKKIESIQFSLLSAADVQKSSQIPIYERNIYNMDQPTVPSKGGPLDVRMGISERGKNCETCKKALADCPGHFGYVKLELPVFHVGYFKHTVNILQSVCKECCRLLLTEDERIKYNKQMRARSDPLQRVALFKTVVVQCKKVKTCPHCGKFNGTVKKMPNFPTRIIHDRFKAKKDDMEDLINEFQHALTINQNIESSLKSSYEELDPQKVFAIFSRIREEDVLLFDMDQTLCQPIDLLITHIPVPPVPIRPSVAVSSTTTNEDDLTVKIAEIIQLNKLIKISIEEGVAPNKLLENWLLMQYTIAQYFNSETPGLPHNLLGNKQIRALSQRLKGKHGRFRQNLSGKRVDFTGRTVISPDPNCAIDQVMIPIYIAKNLTFPERVNRYNISKLRGLVRNGPDIHPGANFVEAIDGNKMLLQYANRKKVAEELQIGDIVERHMENDDIVLFNRQPSLHRVSIMAHRARVMPSRTFRFNECVCTPYNADFDGDEMNVHLPQSEEARAEARILMDVKQNLLIPRSGEPLIAPTQDFLTSGYLITQKDMFLNRSELMKICAYFWDANERIEIPPPTIYKPIELWTGKQIINVLLRPNRKSNVYVNTVVKERNYSGKGEHMCPNDGWVIFKNSELICGNLCKTTMGSGSKTGLFYSLQRDNSVVVAAQCMLRVAKFSARWISNYGMSIGISDVTPFGQLIQEKHILLEAGYQNCSKLIEQYKRGDLVLKAGCNLEQTLESQLNGELSKIRDKAGDILKNTLPKHNSPLIMAVCGSKGSNINLCQMIALVGQQTVNGQRMPNGFFDRSLPHFEPYSKYPASKGFVKNSFYDGLSPTEFFFHTIGGREGLVDTAVKTAETGYMQRRLMKALEDLSVKYDDTVRTSTEHVIQFQYGDDGLDPMFMDDNNLPVSLKRLLIMIKENTKKTLKVKREDVMLPSQIQQYIKNLDNKCPLKNVSGKFLQQTKDFLDSIAKEISKVRKDLGLKVEPSHSELQVERKDQIVQKLQRNFMFLTISQLEDFMSLVWYKYERAQIQPGEAVGAVAAQSIGEPGTQMTLKTFHFAGVASMNVTLGVPRIKEIINATKEISTPIITAKLVNDSDLISSRIVKGRIEKTLLGDIAKYIKEVYTPRGCFLEVKLDLKTVEALKLEMGIQDVKRAILKTPKMKVKEKNIEIVDMKKLHIQPMDTSRDNMYFFMQQLKNMLPHVIVKGIPTVVRAVISKQEQDQSKHLLLVEGYGLKEVMATPGIDFRYTTSNHIIETEQVLGIEAARQKIINEIQYTMQSHGMNIDPRHIQLLADIMTFKGQVLGITRFGVSKMKNSTLMLASFEMTTDHLYESAVHCKRDDITGVSECIIMGNLIPIGTGLFKVVYDETQHKQDKESLLIGQASDQLLMDSMEEVVRDGRMIIKK